jgi:hypothetical protein
MQPWSALVIAGHGKAFAKRAGIVRQILWQIPEWFIDDQSSKRPMISTSSKQPSSKNKGRRMGVTVL